MTQGEAPRPSDIAELWRQRFGEPPPILTDPETMLRVLISTPPRSFAPPGETPDIEAGASRRPAKTIVDFDEPWSSGGGDTTP